MDTIWQDFRYAARRLLRSPGFTAVAVVTLALGIGANSAIFSVVNSLLLRPLPYPDSDRVVMIWGHFVASGRDHVHTSEPELLDYKQNLKTFSHLAAYVSRDLALSDDTGAEMVPGAITTADLFPLLGARAILGRPFLPEEDRPGTNRVVVLSHSLWQRRFGSSPEIVGKTMMINGNSHTVLGVMEPGFHYPTDAELWIPLGIDPSNLVTRAGHYLDLIGRVRPELSLEQAQAELTGFAGTMVEMYPFFYSGERGWGLNLVPLQQQLVGEIRLILFVLLGAVGFVLLIACVNVANLLLVRAQRQHKEISVRTALGASRGRLVRQLFIDSLVLSLLGGGLGLLFATWGTRLLVAQTEGLPRAGEIRTDGWVLSFALLMALLTSLLISLLPALRSFRVNLTEALKEGGGKGSEGQTRERARAALVIAEIALALILLIGSGLLIGGLYRLTRTDPGFQADNVMTMRISLPRARYPEDPQLVSFYRDLLERVQALPNVEEAGLIGQIPFGTNSRNVSFTVEGRKHTEERGPAPITNPRAVSPGYFQTMGIRVLAGRALGSQDQEQALKVAVIDEAMAERFWPDEDPLGKRVNFLQGGGPGPWMTIVGVVASVKDGALEGELEPHLYYTYEQIPDRAMYLAVRSRRGDTANLVPEIRRQVQELDRLIPLADVASMEDRLSRSMARQSLTAKLLSLFAALAVILAAIGLYGVMSYSVLQRRHEIGIRMALGAGRGQILGMILRQGLAMALIGVALGLAGSLVLTRVISSLLFGISAAQPGIFLGGALLLTGVALLASYLPARRTTRLDPVIALRS